MIDLRLDREVTLSAINERSALLQLQALSSRINFVNEIAAAMNQSLELPEIIKIVKQQTKWLLDYNYCNIRINDQHGKLVEQYMIPTPVEVGDALADTSAADKLHDLVVDRGCLQAFNPSQAKPRLGSNASWIGAPLLSEGKLWGAILFCSTEEVSYTADDLRIASLFSMQLANVVRNAYRFAETKWLYAQLAQAHADLKRSEQARADLSRMIIHDIRSPLSVIGISLHLMEMSLTNDGESRTRAHIQRAMRATEESQNLVSDLLDIAKLENVEVQLEQKTININALITQAVENWQPQINTQFKQLSSILSEAQAIVRVDERLVKRVIDNLIGNALKFTKTGDEISVTATVHDGTVQIAVQDNGLGIPLEEQPHIFEQFVQVTDEQGRPLRSGTGIGLAFCQLVIQAHQGKIWVESTLGHGSTFHFTLPIHAPNIPAQLP